VAARAALTPAKTSSQDVPASNSSLSQVEVWEASERFVHAAYTKRKDDDDFGQAGTRVREFAELLLALFIPPS
jgi:hypothetical protein